MPLNNAKLDRKADEYLSALLTLFFVGLAAKLGNGEYFWIVFTATTALNLFGFVACCANDD